MRIVEHHMGISILENGERVVTPFSYFGQAYLYSDDLYSRFVTRTRILQWTVALCVVAGGVLMWAQIITIKNRLELITVMAVLGDLCRVMFAKIMFNSIQRYQTTPRFSELEQSFFVLSNLGAAWIGIGVAIFFETVLTLGLVTDILLRRGTFFSTIPVIAVLHLVSYGVIRIQAYQRN